MKTRVGVNLRVFFSQLYGIDFTHRKNDMASGTGVVILGVLSGADAAVR
jgi:hypothetical protein